MSVCTATAIVIRRQSSSLSEGGYSALRWHFTKASYGNEWRRSGSSRLHVRAFRMNEVSVGGRHGSCAASQSITPISAAPGVSAISRLRESALCRCQLFPMRSSYASSIGWLKLGGCCITSVAGVKPSPHLALVDLKTAAPMLHYRFSALHY